jgi:hypothetical protein
VISPAIAALAGGGASLAVIAGWRETARKRRRELDRVGWVDWTAVQLAGLVAVAAAGLIGLRG